MLFAFFYIVVVSWSVWYLFASIGIDGFEWEHCDHDYNTAECYAVGSNATLTNATNQMGRSSIEEYWERYVLGADGRDWYNFVSTREVSYNSQINARCFH